MSVGKKPLLLLALVLLPFLAFAALKLYVHLSVRAALDELIAVAAPYASIRYQGVGTSLGGRIDIDGVQLSPYGFADRIRAKGIEIRTPGLGFLLFGVRDLKAGEYPRKLGLALHGLTLDLNGPLAEAFERHAATRASAGAGHGKPHCGGLRYFGPREYRELGYDRLVSDVSIDYEYEAASERVFVQMEWSVRDLASLRTQFYLGGNPSSLKALLQPPWRVTELRAVYEDLSYVSRVKQYCANASEISVDDYIRAEVGQGDAGYLHSWGFVPGPGLRAAYRQFLEQPFELRVQANPLAAVDPAALKRLSPHEVLTQLNLMMSVNGNLVTDLSYLLEAADSPTHAASSVRSGATRPPAGGKEKGGYRAVRKNELSRYLGRQVRMHASGGVLHEGVLLEVKGGLTRVQRQYASGVVILTVPLIKVERAEVQF
jgi:hypothetical protein